MQGLCAHIAKHIQDYLNICVELKEPRKLMQAVSGVKSLTAPDGEMLSSAQQQYRWRCVSLSSTLVQEWCFNTVFREKKSQTPTPSCLTELRCDPMRKKEQKSFTRHIPDEDDDDGSQQFFKSTSSGCLPSYRPVTHLVLLLLIVHIHINILFYIHLIQFSFLTRTLFFFFFLITVFYLGSLVLKGHIRLCASEMTNYAIICYN